MDNLRCFNQGLIKGSVYKTDYRNHLYDLYNIPMSSGTLRCPSNEVTKESVYKRDYNWPCAVPERRIQKCYYPKIQNSSMNRRELVPLYSPYHRENTPGSDSLYRREYNSQAAIRHPSILKQQDHLACGPGKITDMTVYRKDYRNPAHFRRYPFVMHY